MNTKFRLVVLDLDGTLIDTMGGFADLAGSLIESHYGWSFEKGRRRYLDTSGIPFFQQIETLFPGDQRNQKVSDLFEKRKISVFMKETISERTRETLHLLREREVRTAISSNNFNDLVREFVRSENIPVDLALGFRHGFAKGKDHFDHLNAYFGIPFSQMLFVGDSLMDAQKAAELKITFVGKLGTFSKEDFFSLPTPPLATVLEISEIPGILET